MESINILDPNDDIHIFCLHYVFIARHLSKTNSWIMRSEHNLTPQQLWTAGLQRIAGSQSMIAKEVFEDFNDVSMLLHVHTVNNYFTVTSEWGVGLESIGKSRLQDAVHVQSWRRPLTSFWNGPLWTC